MTRQAKLSKTEEALVRSLALTLSENPGATLQEMASAAGVSRATLYRFAATREQVLEVTRNHAIRVIADIQDAATLETRAPLDALHLLMAGHIREREFCVFLISQIGPYINSRNVPEECTRLEQRMDAFFARGQKEGILRRDVPDRWLTDLFFGVLFSLCESEYRGRIARCEMQRLFEEAFLNGALATAPATNAPRQISNPSPAV